MPVNKQIPYTDEQLFGRGEQRRFTDDALKEIAFPLGGIGTGTVSLGGRGQLRDWEIFNRPGKGKGLLYTFPAIYTRTRSGATLARVLESKCLPPHVAGGGLAPHEVFGLPRLSNAIFKGEYPFAHIEFRDAKLPVKVELTAFNPFIPLKEKQSGIPAAVLRYRISNHGSEPVDVTVCWSLQNAVGNDGVMGAVRRHDNYAGQRNEFVDETGLRGIRMTRSGHAEDDVCGGSMALVTPHPDVTYLEAWTRGGWWDDAQGFWDDFKSDGEFDDNGVHDAGPDNTSDIASLGLKASLAPGESADLPFIFTWHFPNRENYWNREEEVKGAKLRNRYADFWADAWDVARYVVSNLNELEKQSAEFRDALYGSTLPAVVLDAVGANMSIIRTNTGLWLDDDRFYGFEGCSDNAGCCPMNCTHVYNYEQSLAYLFPRLERTMRVTDFTDNVLEDGKMAFRTHLPRGRHVWRWHGAADGQMGCILKAYREYLLSGDTEFVTLIYPGMKKTMDYAWAEWDKDADGVMEGIQHNTYDIEFSGANTMMGTLYLGALRAMQEFAGLMGEPDYADKCARLFESGFAKHAEKLWNGEFFVQDVEPDTALRYQFGPGCLSDQLLGQWFCEVLGLGHTLPADKVRAALQSIFKYNWKSDLSEHDSVQRTYALNDEAGLLLCSWPNGGRPKYPFAYADEVWTGIEYQVAAHLIYEGMLEEGLAITRGVRERHDGIARNPWDEFECGHHYARALASWSLLLALSGFRYSAPERRIAFAPKVNAADFRCFYSTGSGWGVYSQRVSGASLTAVIGVTCCSVEARTVSLALPRGCAGTECRVSLMGAEVAASLEAADGEAVVALAEPVTVEAGQALKIAVS